MAKRLIHHTIIAGSQSAVVTLCDFLDDGSRRQLRGHQITFIAGIASVDHPTASAEGLRYMPYADVAAMIPLQTRWSFDDLVEKWKKRHQVPIGALVHDLRWGPLLWRKRKPELTFTSSAQEADAELLGTTSNQSLQVVGITEIAERPLAAFVGVDGMSMNYPSRGPSTNGVDVSRQQWDEFISLRDFVSSVPAGKARRRITVACSRLASSHRRFGPLSEADRIVDQVVALEALCGARHGPSALLAARIAWLLGSDADERFSIHQQVRAFYNLRSKAVHGDEVDSTGTTIDDIGVVIRRVLDRFQKRGGIPDENEWSRIVLGGAM